MIEQNRFTVIETQYLIRSIHCKLSMIVILSRLLFLFYFFLISIEFQRGERNWRLGKQKTSITQEVHHLKIIKLYFLHFSFPFKLHHIEQAWKNTYSTFLIFSSAVNSKVNYSFINKKKVEITYSIVTSNYGKETNTEIIIVFHQFPEGGA